jgi:hypothetical protein
MLLYEEVGLLMIQHLPRRIAMVLRSLVAHYGRNSAELRIPLRITENRPAMPFRPEFEQNQKDSLPPPLVPK